MGLEVVVCYRDEIALYSVESEKQGIYQAQLVRFHGSPENTPPEEITLTRGVRKWLGSHYLPDLLNAIGSVIETTLPPSERVLNRQGNEPTNPKA